MAIPAAKTGPLRPSSSHPHSLPAPFGYDSSRSIQPSGTITRPSIVSRSGTHMIRYAAFCSSQSSSLKLGSTRDLMSPWQRETYQYTAKLLCNKISDGHLASQSQEHGRLAAKPIIRPELTRTCASEECIYLNEILSKKTLNIIEENVADVAENSPNKSYIEKITPLEARGMHKEEHKDKLARMNKEVSRNVASGQIPLQAPKQSNRMETEGVGFGDGRDDSVYKEVAINDRMRPKTARNIHTTDTHNQFELTGRNMVKEGIHPNGFQSMKPLDAIGEHVPDFGSHHKVAKNGTHSSNSSIKDSCSKRTIGQTTPLKEVGMQIEEHRDNLTRIYDKVLVVKDISTAKQVVQMLTTTYKNFIYACDTEVANIDVKQETPVDHGEIICFSIYSGPQADFGNGKSCIWVDVLDGGRDVLLEFRPFFEESSIKKVWHNYSFDSHVIENYGIKLCGFYADTMHLARLWDSSRRTDGGYSLEALTSDSKITIKEKDNGVVPGKQFCSVDELTVGKRSMKSTFGKKKVKKDGSEGKLVTMAPVELLQRGEERTQWICYSALDSISTLKLFNSLMKMLELMPWHSEGVRKGTMFDFYEEYWRPFGVLLVKMESEGMLVDRAYLSGIEKVAIAEQRLAADVFRKWASKYCPDAEYMNIGSDIQLRQLFFGGIQNSKNGNEHLPYGKTFKVPNIENVIEEGKKTPSKFRTITLHKIVEEMQTDIYTASGWPSVSGDVLRTFAGKISTDHIFQKDYGNVFEADSSKEALSDQAKFEEATKRPDTSSDGRDTSIYGTAYRSFGEGTEGEKACHAIAALCEVCSIDSLISNFILPLQGNHISGKNGRIHCSLNINTETGRLSARRPNLQNQPALEKDRYKIRKAFIANPGNSLIVADYGQLELRILAHLANCKSMLDAFKAGGDFHSRTAMNMYSYIRQAVDEKKVLLEWHPQPGEDKPPVPLLKDAFAAERRKAKMLNFSIAYGKTPAGLSRDWKVSVKEAKDTVKLWYNDRKEVLRWQEARKKEARETQRVYTLLGRARDFPCMQDASGAHKGHIDRAAINAPVQGSAADVAMCAMLEIDRNQLLKDLGWKLLLQVHDEVILEGPSESAELAKATVVECMSKPFYGTNWLKVGLAVDAKCAPNWYVAK